MKIKFEKKYVEIGIVSFCVIAASLLVYYLLFNHTTLFANISKVIKIISPVIYGFIFAFLMTPILNFIEKKMVKVICLKCKVNITKNQKIIRAISIVITVVIGLIMDYLWLWLIMV